jgi:DNA-binding CsgD family transcriptional regulator
MESSTASLDRTAAVIGAIHAWGDSGTSPFGSASQWIERVLDHIDYGIACVDDRGVLLHCNRAARDCWPHVHVERDPILSAIRAASTKGVRRLVDVRCGDRRLQVAVVPLSEPACAGGQVLLVFSKSSVCERLSSYWYGVAKGLTAAEQGVLEEIAQGWSPRDIAERHQVSLTTIRTQIASVREKTGAESIYALLREVAQLPPIRAAVGHVLQA